MIKKTLKELKQIARANGMSIILEKGTLPMIVDQANHCGFEATKLIRDTKTNKTFYSEFYYFGDKVDKFTKYKDVNNTLCSEDANELSTINLEALAELIARMDNGPEDVVHKIEIWCSIPMNFLTLEELHLEEDSFNSKIEPFTWPEGFILSDRSTDNIVFTLIGRFYLMQFTDGPENHYPNTIATFLNSIYNSDATQMYGDFLIISSVTYNKIMGL